MSDSEDETSEKFYKPSFVLIAIDTHPSMFVKKSSDEATSFKNCINACYELANSLIFTQSKRDWSQFAIALAAENDSASFLNFNTNILDSIKLLKKTNELTEDKLLDSYQRKGNFDLNAFFLFCKKKFKEIQSVFYKRTIIYITNDDDPVRGDKNLRFAALNEAKNFEASDIDFQMVTMNHDFDYKKFYNELFSVLKVPVVETIIEDEEGLLEKLSSLVLVRFHQRKLNFFPFLNDKSRFLRVVQKKFIQEEKLYNNAAVTTEGKAIKKISKASDTAKTYKLKYTNEELEFDLQENFEIKNNDLPVGYTLVHVSNRVTDIGFVLSNPLILEVDYKEDLKFFDSFWQYCVDKNKVLICVRKLRYLDKIRYVELIPKFVNHSKVFIIKTIPFLDEINYPPNHLAIKKEDTGATYSGEKINIINDLIDKLTFDYNPKMFNDPSLAKKKAFLRSKFLDEPMEEVEDVTLDNAAIDSCLGEIPSRLGSLFDLDEEEATAKKRKTSAAPRGKPKKKK